MRSLLISSVFGLIFSVGVTSATAAGTVAQGKIIARRSCETCHLSASDIPTFANIARRKTDAQLASYLVNPHPKMPDISLSPEQISDLVTYMRSLAR